MGWFLVNPKKKKKSKPRRTRNDSRGKWGKSGFAASWEPGHTLVGLRCLGVFTLLACLVMGWCFAENKLDGYLSAKLRYRVTPQHVVLKDAPIWMASWLREELRSKVVSVAVGDPTDGENLNRIAKAVNKSPWVEHVNRVTRLPQGKLLIDAAYREPVAMVESRDGYHLVTQEGIALPGLYMRNQIKAVGLPVLRGVGVKPFDPGHRWPGMAVHAGLDLILLLQGEPYFNEIESFDVGGRDRSDRIRMVLHTRSGGQVIWGLPPGDEHALEPIAREKCHRLRSIYRQRKTIDAGGRTVAINGPKVWLSWVDQPDAASPAAQRVAQGDPNVSVGYNHSR